MIILSTLPVRFQEIMLEQKLTILERVPKDNQESLGTARSAEANQIGLKTSLWLQPEKNYWSGKG